MITLPAGTVYQEELPDGTLSDWRILDESLDVEQEACCPEGFYRTLDGDRYIYIL